MATFSYQSYMRFDGRDFLAFDSLVSVPGVLDDGETDTFFEQGESLTQAPAPFLSFSGLTEIDGERMPVFYSTMDFHFHAFSVRATPIAPAQMPPVAPGDFDTAPDAPDPNGIVQGSTGRDIIKSAYVGDPEGDVIDGKDGPKGALNDDVVRALGGADIVNAGKGDDTVYGDGGNDFISGAAGADTLFGGNGADMLLGGKGRDSLSGGRGKDMLTGGGGADEFVFSRKGGVDTIKDFQDDIDTILLSEDVVGSAKNGRQVVNRFGEQTGDDVVLTLKNKTEIVVLDTDLDQLRNDIEIF